MDKRFTKFAPYIAIAGILYLTSLMAIISGSANIDIKSFSVDSSEKLYVGLSGKILVYDEGTQIASFSPKTSRNYAFRVQADDTIILSAITTVYLLDLNGNIIESWDDPGCNVYNELQRGKRQQTLENGVQYSMRAPFGWTRIVRNETEVIYKISPLSYIAKITRLLSAASLIFCVSYCVSKKK